MGTGVTATKSLKSHSGGGSCVLLGASLNRLNQVTLACAGGWRSEVGVVGVASFIWDHLVLLICLLQIKETTEPGSKIHRNFYWIIERLSLKSL